MTHTEQWNLYLDTTYEALPWPWPEADWEDLGEGDLLPLPNSIDDFTRYPPGDGPLSMSGVPANLPRALPVCVTQLAVYHDEDNIYVFLNALRPERPIPELGDEGREDFSCYFEMNGLNRGIYLGLNQDGESICLPKVWDEDTQTPEDFEEFPWSQFREDPWRPLDVNYGARVIRHRDGILAAWRTARGVVARGMDGNRIRFTAGRRCYATAELVSWASNLTWETRHDELGTLVFADEAEGDGVPRIRRIDVAYDCENERGTFSAEWEGVWSAERLQQAVSPHYKDRLRRYTVALNGQEQTGDIQGTVENGFRIADGWNRLEYLNAVGQPPVVISFQKFSGNRIVSGAVERGAAVPGEGELCEQFALWHQQAETSYRAPGIWGGETGVPSVSDPVHCLDHNGVFWMEPYALACLHLERRAEYETKVRESCERVLSFEREGYWYPFLCVDPEGTQPFCGGAFAHGSVGEALALGYRVLGDAKYLDAARRAVGAYRLYLWEDNQNYCAFALWHLAELLEQTGDEQALKWGAYYLQFAGSLIDMSGAQGGHNYYSGYGAITLKGLAKFLRVLPEDHAKYPWLRDRVIRFSNQMVARQQSSGLFAERNRKYLGYHSLEPAVGLFEVAFALGGGIAKGLEPTLLAAHQAQGTGQQRNGLIITKMARYLKEQPSER